MAINLKKSKGTYNVKTGVYTSPTGEKTSTAFPPEGATKIFIDTDKPTRKSSGGGSSQQQLVSQVNVPTQYYGTVTSVPTITINKEALRLSNLKKVAIQRLRERQKEMQNQKFYNKPIIQVNRSFKKFEEGEKLLTGTESEISRLRSIKEAQILRKKAEGKPAIKEKLIRSELRIAQVPVAFVKDSFSMARNLPNLGKASVIFMTNKPFKKIYSALSNITLEKTLNALKQGKTKLAKNIKSNPEGAFASGYLNAYLLGGEKLFTKTGKFAKKFLNFELASDLRKPEKIIKGLHLRIKPGERPVLFKYKRAGVALVKDVRVEIEKVMQGLRKRKKLEIKSEKLKPLVVDLGKIYKKPRIIGGGGGGGTPKPPKPPAPRTSSYSSVVLNPETGEKIIIKKNIQIMNKQAQARLKLYNNQLKKRIKDITFNKPSEINQFALKNLKKKIKTEELLKKRTNNLLKKLIKEEKRKTTKLAKSIYKKRGLEYPRTKSKLKRILEDRKVTRAQKKYLKTDKYEFGQPKMEKPVYLFGKQAERQLYLQTRIKQLKTLRALNELIIRLRNKSLSPREFKQLKMAWEKYQSQKVRNIKLYVNTKTRPYKFNMVIDGKRININKIAQKLQTLPKEQKMALQRFNKNFNRGFKSLDKNPANSIKVIRNDIDDLARKGKEVGRNLKQIQIQKPIQKQIQKQIYIIDDSVQNIRARVKRLRTKNITKTKLKSEFKGIRTSWREGIAGFYIASRLLFRSASRQGQSLIQKSGQAEGQGRSQSSGQGSAQTQPQLQLEKLSSLINLSDKLIQAQKAKKKIRVFFKGKILKEKRIKEDMQPVYNVYGKSRNKFIKINKIPLTKNDALSRGAYAVDHTTARTFKLIPVGRRKKAGTILKREKGYYTKVSGKFRGYKIKRGGKVQLVQKYIEKKGRPLIDTGGERRGLTIAKLIKRNNYK